MCNVSGRRAGDVIVVRSTRAVGLKGCAFAVHAGEFDAIAAYCPDLDRCFFLPSQPLPAAGSCTSAQRRVAITKGTASTGPTTTHSRGYNLPLWGRSSAGRASGWQPEGQGFDPPRLHFSADRESPLRRFSIARTPEVGNLRFPGNPPCIADGRISSAVERSGSSPLGFIPAIGNHDWDSRSRCPLG